MRKRYSSRPVRLFAKKIGIVRFKALKRTGLKKIRALCGPLAASLAALQRGPHLNIDSKLVDAISKEKRAIV
jgi:hypothetical protein